MWSITLYGLWRTMKALWRCLKKYMILDNKKEISIMSLILCYCEKCGQINAISNKELNNLKEEFCVGCDSIGYYKIVPQKYLTSGGLAIKTELNNKFVEDILKSSTNFDQECWDRREAFKEIQKHNNELLENDKIGQSNIPKCPTCDSTDIARISTTAKVVNTAMFGILGQKRKHQFKCNNCKYEW